MRLPRGKLGSSPLAQGSLDPRGPIAEEIAELWWVMLAISVVVFVIFLAALGYAIFRRRDGDSSNETEETSLTPSRWIIWGGVVLPVIVLTAIFVLTIEAMRSTTLELPDDPVVIEGIAHQWWWEFRYEGEEFVTANEIHIPVGEAVELRLDSADVIHSFWVPALSGKIDVLPDYTNTLTLQADEPGDYRGQCAEFCGLQHTKMAVIVIARPRAEFNRWLAEQAKPAAPPRDPLAQKGQEIFLAAGCAECHTIRGTRASGDKGPDLTHLTSRQTLASATIPNTPEHLENWIADPQAVKTGTQMTAPKLTEEELDALTAYLMELR